MKSIRKNCIVTLAIVTAFTGCVSGVYGGTDAPKVQAKAKVKTINMRKGDTYKIKIKKNSKIKLSRKKIVSISKKGEIKALKAGKCKITVKKGKKTWKYNVVVKKKPVNKVTPTPAPTVTPVPTTKPEINANELGTFEIVQKEITTETKSLTYKLNFPKREITFYVKIGDACFEQNYKAEKPGEGEYNFKIDFSAYKPETKIEVGIRAYSDIVEDRWCIWNTRVGYLSKEFVLNKLYRTAQLSLTADQEKITKDTTVISGTLSGNEHIDAAVEILAGGYLIATEKIKTGENTFSIPVDFSKCKVGDMVSVTYSCPGDAYIYETDDYIIQYEVKPYKKEFELK